MITRAAFLGSMLLLAGAATAGCNEEPVKVGETPPGGLTREQAAAVLATVGDEVITVGDFAAALERLNEIDRLRYQSAKGREQLLQEMIDMRLLAQEAKQRGLDASPAVQDAIRQILRDAMLAKAREGLPEPASIGQDRIAAYYEEHADEFREPERRRVSAIVLRDRAEAEKVLAAAKAVTGGADWGELFYRHSIDAPKERDPHAPADLAGDRGLCGPPDNPAARNERIPPEVQKAVFTLASVGDVHGEVVESGGRFYVVRMSGQAKGHTRTLAEAERSIRVAILKEELRKRETALEEQLRKRFEVKVDDAALGTIELPAALSGYQPPWEAGGGGDEPVEAGAKSDEPAGETVPARGHEPARPDGENRPASGHPAGSGDEPSGDPKPR